jgi:hypothetical protein
MTGWGEPWLSDLLAGGYLGLLTLMWALLALGVPRYGARWRLPAPVPGAPPPAGPRVSVCVPARDEAANIGACVRAVLASDYPDLELIVVDDRSSDGTSDAARAAAAGDPRFHLTAGSEPPAGWSGKAWACARAAGEASGALLLFVDADVRVHPGAISALVRARAAEGLGLLSLFGRWQLVSFWERALIPTVGWFIRGAVDLDRVNKPGAEEAFANGQLILLTREAYESVDGHGAVKDQILDDVRLAAAVKRRGHATGLRVAPWAFEVRLYRSLSEILNGYTKNLYEGMGRRPALGMGAVLFVLVGTLAPYLGLAGGLVGRAALGWSVPATGWLAWMAAICALQLLFRARVEAFDGRSPGIAWVHPVSNLLLVWILIRSMGRVEVEWKGRRFVDGRATAGPPG